MSPRHHRAGSYFKPAAIGRYMCTTMIQYCCAVEACLSFCLLINETFEIFQSWMDLYFLKGRGGGGGGDKLKYSKATPQNQTPNLYSISDMKTEHSLWGLKPDSGDKSAWSEHACFNHLSSPSHKQPDKQATHHTYLHIWSQNQQGCFHQFIMVTSNCFRQYIMVTSKWKFCNFLGTMVLFQTINKNVSMQFSHYTTHYTQWSFYLYKEP